MRCLVIDNYDSFTWILCDYITQIFGSTPVVVRNDELTWSELCQLHRFDAIVVSPGPGTVTNPDDFNVSRDALLQDDYPVLGVCLGFQGLAHAFGGDIQYAPVPFHGRTSQILHGGTDLFAGIPDRFRAVRYHSLIVDCETLPSCLVPTAWSDCGVLMALRHVALPKWGIQFHPESILTEHGKRIVENFRDLAAAHVEARPNGEARLAPVLVSPSVPAAAAQHKRVHARMLDRNVPAETVFRTLFADAPNAFWLDSQRVIDGMSRFSFIGCVADEAVRSCTIDCSDAEGAGRDHFGELEALLEGVSVTGGEDLPFEFVGGCVGFMTYEARGFFGAPTRHRNQIPDSLWMHVERYVAVDHVTRRAWLVVICANEDIPSANAWMDEVDAKLMSVALLPPVAAGPGLQRLEIGLSQGGDAYLNSIRRCQEHIVEGETYEVCLTNSLSFEATFDPLALYMVLRRENAAPFGAFLRVGGTALISTSPERFFKVDASGRIEAKPIKGTCARQADPVSDRLAAAELAASEKDRAENLMIVDLMRNDLARVAEPGSIGVPVLMGIESYATVHQMVSTIEARLKPSSTLFDLLRAVFPGGSITGAPKIRTMEIIESLESVPRGIYCGSIGYLGYNRVADMNIAIRTLSYDGREARFGAGGAVTYLSDPRSELDEVLLKADALIMPIWHFCSGCEDGDFDYQLVGETLVLERRVALKQQAG